MRSRRSAINWYNREMPSSRSFTLIELLIVIAVVAILSVVVILALNPAELLKQARDSTRLSDINTLNKALSLYQVDNPSGSFGTASTTYISYPDSSSICGNIGLSTSTIANGYSYACAPSSTYQKLNGTGWVPVNLSSITGGAPISNLPKDPTNTTSSNNYYIYLGNTGNWALSALLESSKYLVSNGQKDGGYDPGRFEKGSSLALISQGEGLVGWWDFEEGPGATTSTDRSGNNNNGSWAGTGTSHYASGKVGMYAASFNGTDDYITAGNALGFEGTSTFSVGAWVYFPAISTTNMYIASKGINDGSGRQGWLLFIRRSGSSAPGDAVIERWRDGTQTGRDTDPLSSGQWSYVIATYDGVNNRIYLNGVLAPNSPFPSAVGLKADSSDFTIGKYPSGSEYYPGWIDDLRVYNRVLTASEISAIYNATR